MKKFRGYTCNFLLYIGLGLIIFLLPFFIHGYLLRFLTLTWIFTISVLGLRLLHIVGEINFSHIGFMAIGAYTSGLLTVKLDFSFIPALIIACLGCALLGLALGYISMKLTGPYFFMVTFAFNQIIVLSLIRLRNITGGYGGLSNIPPPSEIFLASQIPYYYLTSIFLVIIFYVTERIDKTYIGMIFRGIRQARVLSESIGVNVLKHKAYSLLISCVIAGLSGVLFAHHVRFINPDCFSFHYMMDIMTYMIVGGQASGLGSVVGTLLVRGIVEGVGGLRQYELILSSSLLLIVMLFLREGVISLPKKILMVLRGK